MNRCFKEADVPECITKGKTILIQKDLLKGTTPNNYRPITCLPMMWKILTAQIRDLLLINKPQTLPREIEVNQTLRKATLHWSTHPQQEQGEKKNLPSAWIDYKKAYEMVLQSWIINCLKMYKISDEVINFIEKIMETLRPELIAGGRSLAEAKIQWGIFQGDVPSPLLVV